MMRALVLAPMLLWAGAAAAQDHSHHHAPEAPPTAAQEADPHAAHRAQAATASAYRPPALTDADRAAAFPFLHVAHDHGDPLMWMVQADRFERTQDDALAWEGKAWIGHDRGRLWLRSEGERAHGKTESSLEALWGKPLDAWWDVLAGVRHDDGDGPARDWLAVGVQGLAPYKFEVQATAYLGSGGRSMLQAEVEYELLLTNRLILQPRIEAVLNGRDDDARGIGAGLSETSAGLRLRYEVRREFAPYVGYEWSNRHGRTAEHARNAGEAARDRGWVAGLRFWF
ncbi:copper resistance protein B [Thermomonas brevis]|uniref:Copper resistance protein B n=2 Tax=Thermomonas brevis TaxID=215691 RepID=A0A7G9QTY6_9GAMM|nr:copper resistance protein B [Thermomonas brevis]